MLERQLNRQVDAPDRQHAHRAARPVHHAHRRRQQVGHTVARDGVRVAAAELHQVVAAAGVDLGGDGRGELVRERAVAKLVDVFHEACPAGAAANSASVRSASSGSSRASA